MYLDDDILSRRLTDASCLVFQCNGTLREYHTTRPIPLLCILDEYPLRRGFLDGICLAGESNADYGWICGFEETTLLVGWDEARRSSRSILRRLSFSSSIESINEGLVFWRMLAIVIIIILYYLVRKPCDAQDGRARFCLSLRPSSITSIYFSIKYSQHSRLNIIDWVWSM